jgi:hypothetical protein
MIIKSRIFAFLSAAVFASVLVFATGSQARMMPGHECVNTNAVNFAAQFGDLGPRSSSSSSSTTMFCPLLVDEVSDMSDAQQVIVDVYDGSSTGAVSVKACIINYLSAQCGTSASTTAAFTGATQVVLSGPAQLGPVSPGLFQVQVTLPANSTIYGVEAF